MVEIVQCVTETQQTDLRELLTEYIKWTRTINENDPEDAPTFQSIRQELADLPGKFAPEHGGGFYMAYKDDQLAGCLALVRVDDTTCELKRMYVRPAYRGQKIGWQLLQHLLKQARAMDYDKLVLDSHITMKKAHSLYRAVGMKDVPVPEDFPEGLKPIVVFLEMDL